MMRKLALALLAFVLFAPVSALAFGSTAGPLSTTCTQQTLYTDGCLSAATTGYKTTLASLAESGQTWVTRPPFNVPGIDYVVGAVTPGSLADPATLGASVPGCTWNPTGGTFHTVVSTVPTVFCKNSGAITTIDLQGYNFAPTGGHGATWLLIDNSLTDVSIHNNFFQCDGPLYTEKTANQSSAALIVMINAMPSGSITRVYNNTADGDWTGQCVAQGTSITTGFAFVRYQGKGAFSYTYNRAEHFPAHTVDFVGTADATNQFVHKYNFSRGWNRECGLAHGESIASAGGSAAIPLVLEDIGYNTFVQPIDGGGCSTTTVYPMGSSAANDYTQISVYNNLIIAGNHMGGSPQPANHLTGYIDNGLGTFSGACPACTYTGSGTPGSILTITALGTYGGSSPGAYVGNNITPSNIEIMLHVPGSAAQGVGSQWYVQCANAGGVCPAISANPSLNVSLGALTGTTPLAQSNFAVPLGATLNHGTVTNAAYQNNYVDLFDDGASGAVITTYPWGVNGITCRNPVVLSGNVSMTTGASINTLNVVSSTGC